MNQPAAGNATIGLTEEAAVGFLSWLVNASNEGGWLNRLVMPRRRRPPDPKLDEIKRAAAAEAAAMEAENRKYFRQDGPGKTESDL